MEQVPAGRLMCHLLWKDFLNSRDGRRAATLPRCEALGKCCRTAVEAKLVCRRKVRRSIWKMCLGNNYKDSENWARAESWKPPKDEISRGGAWPTGLEIIDKICGLEIASTFAFQWTLKVVTISSLSFLLCGTSSLFITTPFFFFFWFPISSVSRKGVERKTTLLDKGLKLNCCTPNFVFWSNGSFCRCCAMAPAVHCSLVWGLFS